MNKDHSGQAAASSPAQRRGMPLPLKIVFWPFVFVGTILYKHWLSYLFGRALRDENRVYSIKFIWYGDSVYLHPMIWGSVVLFFLQKSGIVSPGWTLLIWFIMLGLCFLTVMYNFDIFKTSVLGICLIAVFGVAYITNSEWAWNPLGLVKDYVTHLDARVENGFYIASAWIFAILISAEVIWAWLFNRVELDESYVYEHRFLQGTTREPIFARGLKRETKDLLELLILGAGDLQHRTKSGYKRYKNVPGASLGLGKAIDSMLDYHRRGEVKLERRQRDDSDQVMPSDAFHDLAEEMDDDGIHDDDVGDDGVGDDGGDVH